MCLYVEEIPTSNQSFQKSQFDVVVPGTPLVKMAKMRAIKMGFLKGPF